MIRAALLLALLTLPIPAQVSLHFTRHPVSIAQALIAPAKLPAGVSTWQVSALNSGQGPVMVNHGAIMHAAAWCTSAVDPLLARAVARRVQAQSRSRRAWHALTLGTELSAEAVPALQFAGVLGGSPWISAGLIAGSLTSRLLRREAPEPLDESVAGGARWLTPGQESKLEPGAATQWLMVASSRGPERFRGQLGDAVLGGSQCSF